MGRYAEGHWPGREHGPRWARRAGTYLAYIPDRLHDLRVTLTDDNARLLGRAEAAVTRLGQDSGRLELLGPLFLRSEAAASSWIEGVTPGARQVALAELGLAEDIAGVSEAARLVGNNVSVLRAATAHLADRHEIRVPDLEELQRGLLPSRSAQHGIRTTQNWVGGSGFHASPLDAAFVPPPPEHVPRLLADLVAFLTDSTLAPLVQAGLVHAQFETIHPFADGNGRVGRALIHTVLRRRGAAAGTLLPISLVLMARQEDYIGGLDRFRYDAGPGTPEADAAVNAWLDVFLRAAVDAADQGQRLTREVEAIRAEWLDRLGQHRAVGGRRTAPRADSALLRILDGFFEAPAMSIESAARLFDLGERAASRAFAELVEAGIASRKRDRGRALFVADDVVALLDLADRAVASPDFDTRTSPPVRATPVLPRGHSQNTTVEPDFSEAARSVWAKTDAREGTSMGLTRHLLDSAAVAGEIWDHWLAPNVRRNISASLPEGEADGRILVRWLAGIHDIGKASPGFAVKARHAPEFAHLVDRMADHGLVCPPYVSGGFTKLPPHCRIGHFLTVQWLEERFGALPDNAHALSIPIGMHHGTPPSDPDLDALVRDPQWAGGRHGRWREVQREILEAMALHTGADERMPHWLAAPPPATAQMLASATVVVADWLASDAGRFPYDDPSPSIERVARARIAHDLRGPWRPAPQPATASEVLVRRFSGVGVQARPIQEASLEVARSLTEPALMIIEAPMGTGKTEAALMAAEVLAERFGCGGIFVALPTMATSDAMFDRVQKWTERLEPHQPATVFLAHGKAHLNATYRGLVQDARVTAVNAGEREFGRLDDEREVAVVSTWLNGRRTGVLANMVTGTIDQVLFGALKVRHLALRQLGLAGKVVILDEVHAADDYMRHYLGRILEWLGAFGTPVVLLSATLPPAHRDYLRRAYASGRGVRTQGLTGPAAYPLLTVQGTTATQRPVPIADTEIGQLALRRLDETDLIDLLAPLVSGGAVAAVVRNTVASAQETYRTLAGAFGAERVMLLHSRFLASDRADRENRLRAMLGPPGSEAQRPAGFVVVGTQVLEQSLDIDADVMITDLAPVDLVLQRSGRLHRHHRGTGESERPAATREAVLHVLGAPDPTQPDPQLDQGSRAVYGTSRLLRAASVLAPHLDRAPVRIPNDIPALVAAAYDPDLAPPNAWLAPWREAELEAAEQSACQRGRASTFRIGSPAERTLVGWLDGRTDDGGDERIGGHAQVRDSEDGIEVIVVYRRDGFVRLLPFGGADADADLGIVSQAPPPGRLTMAAAGAALRLPTALTHRGQIDRTIRALEDSGRDFEGWQKSPWLAGQLVLCLGPDLSTVIDGCRLHYDRDLGLITTREETTP